MIDKVLSDSLSEGSIKSVELAKALGVNTQTLYGWKKGISVPSLDYLPAIVDALKLDINTLENTEIGNKTLDVSLFGQQFKKYRETLDLSLLDIAPKIGISRQTISKWERGESFPNIDNFYSLCSTIGMKPEYFLINMDVESGMVKKEPEAQNSGDSKGFWKRNWKAIVVLSSVALLAAISIPTAIALTHQDNGPIESLPSLDPEWDNPDYLPVEDPDRIPEFPEWSPAGYQPEFEGITINPSRNRDMISSTMLASKQENKRPLRGLGYFNGEAIHSYHRTPYGKSEYYDNDNYVEVVVYIDKMPGFELFIVPRGKTGFEYEFNGIKPENYRIRTPSTSYENSEVPLSDLKFYEKTFIKFDYSEFTKTTSFLVDGVRYEYSDPYLIDEIPPYQAPAGKYLYGWNKEKGKQSYEPVLGDTPIDVTLDLDGGVIDCTIPDSFDCLKIDELPTPSKNGYRFVGYSLDGELINRRTSLGEKCTLKAEYKKLDYTITIDGEVYGHYYLGEEVYLPPQFKEDTIVDHYTTTDGYTVEPTFRVLENLDLVSYEISYRDYFGKLMLLELEDTVVFTYKSTKLRTLYIPESINGKNKFTFDPAFDMAFVDTVVSERNEMLKMYNNGFNIQAIFSNSSNSVFANGAASLSRLQVLYLNNNKEMSPTNVSNLVVDFLWLRNPFNNEIRADYFDIRANKTKIDE